LKTADTPLLADLEVTVCDLKIQVFLLALLIVLPAGLSVFS
jgi:hypothetical protein